MSDSRFHVPNGTKILDIKEIEQKYFEGKGDFFEPYEGYEVDTTSGKIWFLISNRHQDCEYQSVR